LYRFIPLEAFSDEVMALQCMSTMFLWGGGGFIDFILP
jgi:hypothetical protein